MKAMRAAGPLCAVAVVALLAWHVATHMRVTTAITHFLPNAADSAEAKISDSLANAELARTTILAIHGGNREQVVASSRELAAALQSRKEVAWVRSGLAADAPERVYGLYHPRRFAFVSTEPERDVPTLLSDAGLRAAAVWLKRQLASPMGGLVARMAPSDPLQLFQGQLERLEASRGGELHPVDGALVSTDGSRAFLFFATHASAFNSAAQKPLLSFVEQAFAALNTRHAGALSLEWSSLARIAVANERSIKADIERVSTLSTLGVLLLFIPVFGSLRYLFAGLIPLLFGLLSATSVSLLWFGQLHALTLAFGSTLIGVCVDYPFCYINYHLLEPHPDGTRSGLRKVWSAILLGGLTTVTGFLGLAASSFPGIREIAVFGAVGVLAALLALYTVVPALLPAQPKPVPLQQTLVRGLDGMFAFWARQRHLQVWLIAGALLLTAYGLTRVQWQDDLRALSPADPSLLAESEALRARVSAMDAGRMVVALGDDLEAALVANEAALPILASAKQEGVYDGDQSLSTWLWSAQLQARNRNAVLSAPDLSSRLQAAFVEQGFTREAFVDFSQALQAPDPGPLRFEHLLASPLADAMRHFVLPVGDQVAVITFLRGVHDGDALARRLSPLKTVRYFDQTAFLTRTYADYRARVLELAGVGLLLVFLVVWARYRRVRETLAAFLPAVLSAGMTVASFAWRGEPLTMMHAVALLLVLSMGSDYGVFLAENVRRQGRISSTLLSVVIACLTTILSFGLLALSDVPALAAIGETVALGSVLSLLLAPTALVVLGVRKAEE